MKLVLCKYTSPLNCTTNVSTELMDPFLSEQQIEELVNFDYVEKDLSDLIEEQNDFNMNEYLNSNYDY